MYIVPYIVEQPVKSKTEFTMYKAWVFLENGGTQLWEEEGTPQEIVERCLTPNGFQGKITSTENDCLMFEISPKTDFSDLYRWEDFLQETKDISDAFVLRPFIWIGDVPGEYDEWGWREECEEVSLGRFGNVADLWTRLLPRL